MRSDYTGRQAGTADASLNDWATCKRQCARHERSVVGEVRKGQQQLLLLQKKKINKKKKKFDHNNICAHTHGRSAPLDIDSTRYSLSPFSFLVLYGFGIDACTSIFSTLITPSTKKVKDREREEILNTDSEGGRRGWSKGQTNKRPDTFFRECIHDTIAPLLVLSLIMQRYLKDDHI